ncbi:hypothetical protein FAD93_002636 [Enterococcus faecalis]|nr:hypothetical protein [Enterococcus faecalis]EGO8595549.1 hypothetical protein [Enterococcus faecalis]EIR8762525.1 hypothetical protein [Enterococcus faecalis]
MENILLFLKGIYSFVSAGIDYLLSLFIQALGFPLLYVLEGISRTQGFERICFLSALFMLVAIYLTILYYIWTYIVPLLVFFVPLISFVAKILFIVAAAAVIYLTLKKQCLRIQKKIKKVIGV